MNSNHKEIEYVTVHRTSEKKRGYTGRENAERENAERENAERKRLREKKRKQASLIRQIKGIGLIVCICIVIWVIFSGAPGLLEIISPSLGNNKEDISFNQGGSYAQMQPESVGETEEAYQEILELFGPDVVSGSSKEELLSLEKLLDNNAEARDFVLGYPNRTHYRNAEIDLTGDFVSGTVPLLMQWDQRWGYDLYGDSMIGLAGCGPTCMTMVYLYFTGDTSANPRTMAEFAYQNGYYVNGGTSWDLWTSGAEKLGLKGEELPLDQFRMEKALENGSLIVCSMRPGDFTTTGHFILLYDYDENGFYVNDPNRRSNSQKQWTYDTLKGQIKNLWAISE